MIRFLVCLSLVGFGTFASAKTPVTAEPLDQVISLEQFRTLTKEQKVIYIRGLQHMMIDLNEVEAPNKGADNTHLYQLLVPTAFADGEMVNGNLVGGPCIFAGNVLTFASNGLCPRPPQGSCLSGQIQCNALVFGDGVCTAANSRATYNCMQSAKSVADIISYAESHKGEWQDLSKTLGSYCKETGTQGLPCRIVQSRLDQMRKVAEIPDMNPDLLGPPPPPKVVEKKPKVPMPKPRPTGTAGAPGAPGKVIAQNQDDIPPRPPMAIPDAPKAPKPAVPNFNHQDPVSGKAASQCDLNKLYGSFLCKTGANTTEMGMLMSYEDAYKAFCSGKPLDKDFDKYVRDNIAVSKKCIDRGAADGNMDKSVTTYNNNYLNKDLLPNYEKCVADLKNKALPASKEIGTMELEWKNDEKGFPNIMAQAKVKGQTPQNLGQMYLMSRKMSAKPFALCDLKYSGKITGNPPKAAAQKGAQ